MTAWLTHNQIIQAAATICTIAGGAVLLIAAARFVWRFLREAYRTSFKRALKSVRSAFRHQIVWSALDLHYHFALTTYYGSIAAIGLFVPLMFASLPLSFLLAPVGLAVSVFALYGLVFAAFLTWISLKVVRRRSRRRRRRMRNTLRSWRRESLTSQPPAPPGD